MTNTAFRFLLLALAVLLGACGTRDTRSDVQAIQALMRAQFDRPDATLEIDPVAVVGAHAVAGWTQGELGGRALLRRRESGWALVLCAGDAILQASALEQAEVPAADARKLAARLAEAETKLTAERRAHLARFRGVVRMDAQGQHRPATPAAASTGPLELDAAASRLSFVSIKNNTVAEIHRFTSLTGGVTPEGEGRVEISLDSVQTGIELRDQRLRELLFETAKFPKAVVNLTVDLSAVRALAAGAHVVIDTEARLDLHGIENRLPVSLRITRTGADAWLVTSESPVIVSATNHGLINGVEALRTVVGLQAIGSGVPVSFALRFTAPRAEAHPAGGDATTTHDIHR